MKYLVKTSSQTFVEGHHSNSIVPKGEDGGEAKPKQFNSMIAMSRSSDGGSELNQLFVPEDCQIVVPAAMDDRLSKQ